MEQGMDEGLPVGFMNGNWVENPDAVAGTFREVDITGQKPFGWESRMRS